MKKLFVSISASPRIRYTPNDVVIGKHTEDYWLIGKVRQVNGRNVLVRFYNGNSATYRIGTKSLYKIPKLTTRISRKISKEEVKPLVKKFNPTLFQKLNNLSEKHTGGNVGELIVKGILSQII